ncbi:hypothetical protein [Flavobacterium sp.]|uniref:hypothetical protein n=1 Tax=Flavobacterium sp. TaxID=239 RepID=UPI00378DA3F4
MTIFTKKEADSAIKYYSEKVIGKPITKPDNSNPFLISSLEITKLKEDEYTVYCLSKYIGNIFRRNLDEVITELDILPLEEFLSNLNQ